MAQVLDPLRGGGGEQMRAVAAECAALALPHLAPGERLIGATAFRAAPLMLRWRHEIPQRYRRDWPDWPLLRPLRLLGRAHRAVVKPVVGVFAPLLWFVTWPARVWGWLVDGDDVRAATGEQRHNERLLGGWTGPAGMFARRVLSWPDTCLLAVTDRRVLLLGLQGGRHFPREAVPLDAQPRHAVGAAPGRLPSEALVTFAGGAVPIACGRSGTAYEPLDAARRDHLLWLFAQR
ncbi:hypothetical protein [Actinomadura parmotrematis]|uniref:Uncharacterized protein n=1 Tax=Actinomadura parmotrematis TaxID=2864039 RepID=A0ABS7FRJ6_9ACTN|nr:hypothetical protein [Actinomadura parmotrematis]MBW8482986.1 hypothetical protein [Actinomadura parmotrematis]